jgi:hypothetical protein
LTAIGMAMVMVNNLCLCLPFSRFTNFFTPFLKATYQNDPQHLSGLFRRILYQFIGPNWSQSSSPTSWPIVLAVYQILLLRQLGIYCKLHRKKNLPSIQAAILVSRRMKEDDWEK